MGASVTIDVRWLRFAAWAFLCLMILSVGLGVGWWLISNPPEANTIKPKKNIPVVRTEEAKVIEWQVELSSQGEVTPRRRTGLSAEVGGKLVMIHEDFEAGETFEEEDLLLQIDRADYDAAHANAEAVLADADLALELEETRKVQALRDWKKLGNGKEPSNLVKRVPQLASAKAAAAAAQAAVDKALRDLERTEIRAPYACRIERTYVDVGAVVSRGMPLVDLVSLGPVEVRLPLSLEDYGYLQRGENGRAAGKVTATGLIGGEKLEWKGTILRSEEIVERNTRSINVVVEFGRDGEEASEAGAPPIGMFVEATVTGRSVPGVVEVKRVAMLEAGKVLLLSEANTLEFREVEVLRTEADVVIVSKGLGGGERIILTPLSAPVAGARVLDEADLGKEEGDEAEEPEAAAAAP